MYNDFEKKKTNLDAKMQDLKATESFFNTLSYIPIVNIFICLVHDVAGNNEIKSIETTNIKY